MARTYLPQNSAIFLSSRVQQGLAISPFHLLNYIIREILTAAQKICGGHGCTIKDGCLIGMGAIVLDDAIVGEESLIDAGCVVKEKMKISPRSLVAGVPGKDVRELTDEDVAGMLRGTTSHVDTGARLKKALS